MNEKLDYTKIIEESAKTHNVLVDFFATWCPPCQTLLPILERISNHKDWIPYLKIIKINIDENPVIATKYRIQSLPTLILILKHPQEIRESARQVGGLSEKALVDWLDQYKIRE